jgi:hypothetical protein
LVQGHVKAYNPARVRFQAGVQPRDMADGQDKLTGLVPEARAVVHAGDSQAHVVAGVTPALSLDAIDETIGIGAIRPAGLG